VPETVERLLAALDRRSITVFAQIDHAQGARGVGLELPDETVVVFVNRRAGTPLMQADPTSGIELPLKILVWDDHGTTRLAYRDPERLARRASTVRESSRRRILFAPTCSPRICTKPKPAAAA